MNEQKLKAMLHYGYQIPENDSNLPEGIIEGVSKSTHKGSKEQLIKKGIDALIECFSEMTDTMGDKEHIVPLSAGLDSRTILGGLLETVGPEKIHAISFGTPGTWDFDLPRKVAHEMGVKHTSIDLWNYGHIWTESKLADFVKTKSHHIPFYESYLNFITSHVLDHNQSVVWSGWMGDTTAGSHLYQSPSSTWDEAKIRFANRKTFNTLTPDSFNPIETLPDKPFLSGNELSFDEQLYFATREKHQVRPIVIHGDFATPFANPIWTQFILNVEPDLRYERDIFKKIVQKAFPELFNLPTDFSFGLPLGTTRWKQKLKRAYLSSYNRLVLPLRVYLSEDRYPGLLIPGEQYLNFSDAFRNNSPLSDLVENSLDRLQDYDALSWLEPIEFWEQHQRGQNDYEHECRVLSSLELHLNYNI